MEKGYLRCWEGPYLFHDCHRPWSHGDHRGHSSGIMGLGAQLYDLLEDVHGRGVKAVTLQGRSKRDTSKPTGVEGH